MDGVHAGTGSIMCSYNRVNNSYGCQNSKTLNGILKGELDFQGFVISDWGAQHAGVATANAGLDLTMPDAGFWGTTLVTMVLNGSVSEERVTDMATRYTLREAFYTPFYEKLTRSQNCQCLVSNGTGRSYAACAWSWNSKPFCPTSSRRCAISRFCSCAARWCCGRARVG